MIAIPRAKQKPCVGLIAMPWYSVWVPSVQLGVLRRCLHDLTQVDSYELYVDYAAMISTQLYDRLSGGGEFVEEWLFAQHYFRGEGLPYNDDVASCDFPSIGIGNPQQEKQVLKVLAEVTGDYLIKMRDMIDWGKYDVIGFTLGIAQTSASMALAALIRRKFPHVRIVFGGSWRSLRFRSAVGGGSSNSHLLRHQIPFCKNGLTLPGPPQGCAHFPKVGSFSGIHPPTGHNHGKRSKIALFVVRAFPAHNNERYAVLK